MNLVDQFLSDIGQTAPPAGNLDLAAQFAADAASPIPATSPTPSKTGSVADFGAALGHHLMNLPHGLAQGIENSVNYFAQKLPDNPVSQYIGDVTAQDNQAMTNREKQYQQSTPNNAASYAGAGVGEVAPFLFGGGLAKGLGAAGKMVGDVITPILPKSLAYAGKLADFGTQGALIGAASPVAGPDYGDQKLGQIGTGALTGPLVKMGGDALINTGSAIKNAAAPILSPEKYVARQLASKLGSDLPDVLNNIKTAPTFIQGSQPLTDQVAGSSTLVQMSKALQNASPDYKNAVVNRMADNDTQRLATLQGVAQTPQALSNAVATRSNFSSPFYASLESGLPVPTAPVFDQVNSVMNSSLGTDPAVKKGLGDLMSGITSSQDANGAIRPDLLDGYRQNLNKFIAAHSSNGVVPSKVSAALEPIRQTIMDAVEQANPGYRAGLDQFRQLSVPINTLQAGQDLMGTLASKSQSANGNPMLTAQSYNSQLAKALRNQDYPIDPTAQTTLQNIGQDLLRETRSNSIRTPGSDTGYNLSADGWLANALYGKNFGGSKGSLSSPARLIGGVVGAAVGHTIGHPLMGLGAGYGLAEKLASFAGNRVNKAAANLLSNPDAFASAVGAAQQNASNPASQAIANALRRYLPGIGAYQAARANPLTQ